MKSFAYTIFFLLVFTTAKSSAQNNEFVYFKDDKFMLQCDEHFPLVMNYMLSIYDVGNGHYIGPHSHYYNYNNNCYGSSNCLETLEAHLALIKQMGFNTVRIGGFNISSSDTTNLYYKLNTTTNNVVLSPNQYDAHFDLIEQFIDLAWDSVGLRVILIIGSDGIENQNTSNTYKNYLKQLIIRFADKPAILAYDLYNEPCFHDKGNYSKAQTYQFVKDWYDTIRQYSPNQLVTIGLTYANSVFEWDPAVMSVDFISYHPYGLYQPIDETLGYIKWYSIVTQKPWIIGETGFSGTDRIPFPTEAEGSLLEQRAYADSTLKMARDCGGKGYSWWHYQDVNWDDGIRRYIENHQGLMTRSYAGDPPPFPSTSFNLAFNQKSYTVDGEPKPASEVFDPAHFDPFNYGTCPSVYDFKYFDPRDYNNVQLTGYIYGSNGQPLANAYIEGKKQIYESGIYYYPFYRTYTNSAGYYELSTDPTYSEPIGEVKISYYGLSLKDTVKWSGITNYTCTLSNIAVPPILDIYDYDIVLPAGTFTWDWQRYIYKKLTLSSNCTLTVNTDVFFSENAELILEPGAMLILENGSNLIAMCDSDLWQGSITIRRNACLELKSGSTIKIGGNGYIIADYA